MNAAADPLPMSLKAVIYATDMSSCSENAGRYASLLARQFGADLLVSHAFVLSQAALEVEAGAKPSHKSRQRQDLEIALTDEAQRLGADAKSWTPILLEGDAREQIPRIAQENAPSIIVLGTSGKGRIERGLVGSVAEGILRSTNVPSLTVGPLVPALDPGTSPFRRILYATGLSTAAARGATYAVGIAKAFHATMDVLHVINPVDVEHPDRFNEIQRRFRTVLDSIVPEQAADICNPEGFVEVGKAQDQILSHIREFSVDLLVLSIRKSSHLWLASRMSGAFQIVADAPCPVMTITGE